MANREHAQTLYDTIQAHRAMFKMHTFVGGSEREGKFILHLDNIEEGAQKCGTTLCAAGFAGMLAGVKFNTFTWREEGGGNLDWENIGRDYLGIDQDLTDEIFYTDPNTCLKALYMLAKGKKEHEVTRFIQYEGGSIFSGLEDE